LSPTRERLTEGSDTRLYWQKFAIIVSDSVIISLAGVWTEMPKRAIDDPANGMVVNRRQVSLKSRLMKSANLAAPFIECDSSQMPELSTEKYMLRVTIGP